MINRWMTVLVMALTLISANTVFAADPAPTEDQLTKEEQTAESEASKNPKFADSVKEKYKLTDEQMKKMTDAGISGPGLAKTAELAASSGKPLDDVIKMRTEQKMGWGKIAKELGVHPSALGQSVASLRKDDKGNKHAEMKAEKREAKEERKKSRDEATAERKEQKAERKQERKGKKDQG